jgi:signal transduction histidine kinase/ActR/RegA family two-component response regulator
MSEEHAVVLSIDDSHGNLDAFERMLKQHLPYAAVHLATTAAEGLMIATQRDVDVVFVDLGLRAESDGLSLIRELKLGRRTAHIPVVLVVPPRTDPELIEEAYEIGVDAWVGQVFEPLPIKACIRTMMHLKRSADRLRDAGLGEDAVLEEVIAAGGAAFIGALDKSADGLVVTGPDHRIRFINQVAAAVLGGDRRSLIGKPVELPLNGDPLSEVDLVGKDGQLRKVQVRSQAVRSEHEPMWVVSLRDVTEQTHIEDQLGRALKMEVLGQLAGNVAHDFKNIIHGILGFTDLMRTTLDQESEEWRYLLEIEKAAERGSALTQQLQAMSGSQKLEMMDLDINEVIETKFDAICRVVGPELTVEFFPTGSLPLVSGDPSQIEQLVLHLCRNSREATPPGGTVTITTGLVRFDDLERREYTWATAGRYVTLSVDDNGCGMSPQIQSRVFEPFFTTKSGEGNVGLSLAIVHNIVVQHQGNIEVISAEEYGTEVTIYLPTTERDSRRTSIPPTAEPQLGARAILLAEDDNVVRLLTTRILERAGCTVYAAGDGARAIELFEQHCDEIVMAVLDVAMPHLTGTEVFETLLASRPDLPVLFVTADGERTGHQRFNLEQQVEVLEKPFRPPALLRKVRELLTRAQRLDDQWRE